MNNLFSATLFAFSDFLLCFFSLPDLPSSFSLSCSLSLSLSLSPSKSALLLHSRRVSALKFCADLWMPAGIYFALIRLSAELMKVTEDVCSRPGALLRSQQGPLHGALGPRRDRAWRLRSQHRPKPWRKPSIGSGHNIHTVLFPITAALLSSDRNSQRVWDVEAPDTGLITGHDLRKKVRGGFSGVGDHFQVWLSVVLDMFLLAQVIFLYPIHHSGFYF